MTTNTCSAAARLRCLPMTAFALPALLGTFLPVGFVLAATDEVPATNLLPAVVVTAVHDHSPAHVVADPRQARQPVPASDAADYLKTIPGFSAIRSGGSNGDPVFRGQSGSRLQLLVDGTQMPGACPSRMDSPSSYISPDTFDTLTVIKGPQTVLWGPGASAGVVRFDRERPDFTETAVHFSASLLGASAGRIDQSADFEAGNDRMYVRATANHSRSRDYRDGNGRRVPSAWKKWNTDLAVGLTPDRDTLLEFGAGAGDGEARYGGRGMDGTRFRRDSMSLRFEKRHLAPWFTGLDAQLYRNEADHVMDNFTLRTPPATGMMAGGMARNVRRTTTGGRLAATLQPGEDVSLIVGFDFTRSPHDARGGTPLMPYGDRPRVRDARLDGAGVFTELTWQVQDDTRWITGVRLDRAKARRYPATGTGMAAMGTEESMSASNRRTRNALPGGFVRWERDLPSGATAWAGVGHVQRFPDYWELISPGNSSAASGNAFSMLQPEKTTQLDAGLNWQGEDWLLWSAAYAGRIQDYILFDYQGMSSQVGNVNARIVGIESGGSLRLSRAWTLQGTLAYNRGQNTTDREPLPQVPPLEVRVALDHAQGPWSAGVLWRMVASQHRYARDKGNVVGRDRGASAGFSIFSLHADYRVNQRLKLALGIDNVFDKAYAEHLNLAGNAGFGYPGGVRMNEPGRTLWLRADVRF